MGEDHAVPPSPEEHRRRLAKLRGFVGFAFFGLVGVLWLLLEFGGETVHDALGMAGAAALVLWVVTWPLRRYRQWRRGRRRARDQR